MNKSEIAQQIKETEEKLAALRLELEKPEYPTLADSKPGDKLENGCIVVHKFSDVKMALIAAPKSTMVSSPWSNDFNVVFEKLEQHGFNRSQWFIPNVRQLELAYNNCQEDFGAQVYWSSIEASSDSSYDVDFSDGMIGVIRKTNSSIVRAFSLVSY